MTNSDFWESDIHTQCIHIIVYRKQSSSCDRNGGRRFIFFVIPLILLYSTCSVIMKEACWDFCLSAHSCSTQARRLTHHFCRTVIFGVDGHPDDVAALLLAHLIHACPLPVYLLSNLWQGGKQVMKPDHSCL